MYQKCQCWSDARLTQDGFHLSSLLRCTQCTLATTPAHPAMLQSQHELFLAPDLDPTRWKSLGNIFSLVWIADRIASHRLGAAILIPSIRWTIRYLCPCGPVESNFGAFDCRTMWFSPTIQTCWTPINLGSTSANGTKNNASSSYGLSRFSKVHLHRSGCWISLQLWRGLRYLWWSGGPWGVVCLATKWDGSGLREHQKTLQPLNKNNWLVVGKTIWNHSL